MKKAIYKSPAVKYYQVWLDGMFLQTSVDIVEGMEGLEGSWDESDY